MFAIAAFIALFFITIILISLKASPAIKNVSSPQVEASKTITAVDSTLNNLLPQKVVNNINTESIYSNSTNEFIDLKYSPNGQTTLLMTNIQNTDTLPIFSLKYINKESNEIELESGNIIYAEFADNNLIYYQKISEDYGIYLYSIPNNTKKKIIDTADPESFSNISIINENKFFFIQPKTGKYGYGNISTGEMIYIGQKFQNPNSVDNVNVAVYSNPVISPDRSILGLIDNSSASTLSKTIKLFKTSDSSLTSPILTSEVLASDEIKYEWSSNGKYLVVGKDPHIFDIKNAKVINQEVTGGLSEVSFSPDSTKALICNFNRQCQIQNLDDNLSSSPINTGFDINNGIWLNNNILVLSIADSIYSFNLENNYLEQIEGLSSNSIFINTNTINTLAVIDNQVIKTLNLSTL